ncbi:ribosome biogenesis regulatory protein homolog [Haliotis asinina]|uniref:ribosome biogenesis regulatory protein homolog n=1 Tax=Haliotis asinina TaxID=109174 RepID=UPI003532529C
MADIVENVLRAAAERESKYKSIEVEKDIDLDLDEGNLLASDPNPIDLKVFRANREDFLTNLSRDNTQLLLNRLWQLPTEKIDDAVVAQLPEAKTPIPREKPPPKPRAPSRWQEYAKLKGIVNRKKSRMVWDEVHKEYRPRWGYKRANDDTKDWLIEVPQNADPNEDQFAKRKKAKTERIAKNELQRLRNYSRARMSKVPGVGLTPTEKPSKEHLSKALAVARKSTASIGHFTDKLPNEKKSKYSGKKRKFESNYGDLKVESSRQMDILNSICNQQPRLNITQAVNSHINDEQVQQSRKNGSKKTPKKQKGGGKGVKSGKIGKGGKGGKMGKGGKGGKRGKGRK